MKCIATLICLCILAFQSVTAQKDQTLVPVSKSKARLWSIGATMVPIAVGGGLLYASFGEGSDDFVVWGLVVGSTGLLFGPAAGHAYAHQWRPAVQGTVLRGVIGGGFIIWGLATFDLFDEDNSAGLLFSAGSLIVVISAIHDLATVGKSVDRENRSHGFANARACPTYFASHKAPGLILTLSF